MLKALLLVTILISSSVYALQIDEKLTLRIIKTSDSSKTILINRGFEDGLVKGDHAKFFLSVGVVGRGVLIKGSPTRSVWSIYRLVNADFIKNDQVMNLKITSPVVVTKDESRALIKDDTPAIVSGDPRDLGIELAPGANDLTEAEKAMVQKRSNALMSPDAKVNIGDKYREFFGTFYFGQFSSKTTSSKNEPDGSGTESTTAINAGYEYYFRDESQWFSRISLLGQFSMSRTAALSHEGSRTEEATNEYGGGVNIYPLMRPKMTGEFIYYGNFTFMMGSTTTTVEPRQSSQIQTNTAQSLGGSTLSYSFGGGIKYYTLKGYGARIQFDYIIRADQFAADSNNTNWVKSKSGPRVVMGFSYRF